MEKSIRNEVITFDLYGMTQEEMTVISSALIEYGRLADENFTEASTNERQRAAALWLKEKDVASKLLGQLDKYTTDAEGVIRPR